MWGSAARIIRANDSITVFSMWMALGIGLILLLSIDVFLSVFQAQGRPGPVTRNQNRVIWQIFRSIGRSGSGHVRSGVLSLAAPTMVVMTILSWVMILTLGYALIYFQWIEGFIVSPGSVRTPWIESLYFSGYTAATLGYGDVVPDLEALRLLAPLQAFSGFALVSVTITYLLATYRELVTMRTAASKIASYFKASGIHSPVYLDVGGYEQMTRWSEETADMLMHIVQAHFQYPILHYFRPARQDWSLPVQLGNLLDLREHGKQAEDAEAAAVIRAHPSFLTLFDTVDEYLSDVGHYFVPQAREGAERGEDEDPRKTHEKLLKYMLYR